MQFLVERQGKVSVNLNIYRSFSPFFLPILPNIMPTLASQPKPLMKDSLDILIIDDETQLRQMLTRLLLAEDYSVIQAENVKIGLKELEKNQPLLVLCDVKLPDGNGVEITKNIKLKYPDTEVILLTAYGTIHDGVQAIKNGAFNYLVKGDDNNKILPLVSKAIEKAKLQFKIKELQTKLAGGLTFENIIGNSDEIQKVIHLAQKVAPTNASVLLTGETGTGKEIFAQAIHNASQRAGQPYIALNTSAFSREILESELFGHKAGAFTGALRDKKGLLEEADKGTLFLDEIGEMSPNLQAKLLRVLESGEFLKVGETKAQKVDVRIIAATNRNLQEEAETGHFRLDLYYRLAAFQIQLPSLNERRKDIPVLAQYFLAVFSNKLNKKWFTLYVQTPRESVDKIPLAAQRHLINNFKTATELDAEVIQVQSHSQRTAAVVEEIMKVVKERRITTICIGKPHFSIWQILFGGTIFNQLLKELSDDDVDVIILS